MRFKEISLALEAVKQKAKPATKMVKKASSSGTRYNSEVGMLAAFCDADISAFDPNSPENSFPAEALSNSAKTFADIKKFLAPVYDQTKFGNFYNLGLRYKQKILEELGKLNQPLPTSYEWSGGSNINAEGAADIIFAGHPSIHGVSIKDESGITLSNLTPKAIGLEDETLTDPDVFARFAGNEWRAMKKHAFESVLKLAMSTPGQAYVPVKDKYRIVYHQGAMDVAPAKPAPKAKSPATTPGIANQKTTLAVSKQPMGQEPTALSEQTQGYFEIFFDSPKTYKATYEQILAAVPKNANWQRVFGDHVQATWTSDTALRSLGDTLFHKISEIFLSKIKVSLENSDVLHRILRMGRLGYFYATPKNLYFVPGVDQVNGLRVKDVVYGAPEGTAQKFLTTIGFEGGIKDATILVYVRYANGMFDQNPTVRGQDLKNPEGISWTKLV